MGKNDAGRLTNIQEEPQLASLFQAPADYTKMDMSGKMDMRGMMQHKQ
ncbi:MAG: hypothetical protein WBV55_10120 [Candidatus Sulfotelmatobacter sp.]